MNKTRLDEIIFRRGLERKQIAKDLNIERRTLDNYINESTQMNSEMIKKMANYLNVSTDYLLRADKNNEDYINEKVNHICEEIKEILYHLSRK
ncbi:MAG: helix-turn-helix domain-containing protein [Anaeroplasmataceae bacterium]|nr:helix-turn-helix domain-containing protein [Anaeroplasmataceae bacterium]